ncbi:MAG TPA: hypothetical protein VIH68_03235 [Bacteroidota bacterium]
MTIEELEVRRSKRWRWRPELALDSEEEMLGFVDDMGFCLVDQKKNVPLPSLARAIDDAGSPRRSPEVNELLSSFWDTYRPKKKVLEWNCFFQSISAVSVKYLPLLYAVVGDRRPDRDYRAQFREKRLTLQDVRVYEMILQSGPITWRELRVAHNAWQKKQVAALELSLQRLWKGLKILRVAASNGKGSQWQATCSWDVRLLKRSLVWSRQEALQHLILHYVDIAIAVSRREIQRVFHGLADSSAINAAVNQLFLASLLDVDPTLVLHGKKAIVRKVR